MFDSQYCLYRCVKAWLWFNHLTRKLPHLLCILVSYTKRKQLPTKSESEMSAVLCGCTRFHDYIYSQKVTVETDHKPLIGIMTKPLHKLSWSIQSNQRKLPWYDINATWNPGKETFVPDCLSRTTAKQAASMQELDVIVEVDYIISRLPVSPEKLREFQNNTANDANLKLLQSTVMQGWSAERSKVPEATQPYFAFCDEIVYLWKSDCKPKSNANRNTVTHSQGIVKSKQCT